jgi:hypothetical protein
MACNGVGNWGARIIKGSYKQTNVRKKGPRSIDSLNEDMKDISIAHHRPDSAQIGIAMDRTWDNMNEHDIAWYLNWPERETAPVKFFQTVSCFRFFLLLGHQYASKIEIIFVWNYTQHRPAMSCGLEDYFPSQLTFRVYVGGTVIIHHSSFSRFILLHEAAQWELSSAVKLYLLLARLGPIFGSWTSKCCTFLLRTRLVSLTSFFSHLYFFGNPGLQRDNLNEFKDHHLVSGLPEMQDRSETRDHD